MICFIHIEKAGGTTLHYLFRNNFMSHITLTPWDYWTNADDNSFQTMEAKHLFTFLRFVKSFGGHTTRSYLNYESVMDDRVDYITFLREPVSRYISHYNHQKNVMKIDWSIHSFLKEKRFDNFMTKRIAGSEDLDKAKRILDEKFSFVGLIESFDESLLLMKNELPEYNFDVRYEVKNKSNNKNYQSNAQLTDKTILNEIKKRNQLDIELYRYAKSTLYSRYKKRYKDDMETSIRNLENENMKYKFSKAKHLICVLYRWFLYRNFEYILHRRYHHPV